MNNFFSNVVLDLKIPDYYYHFPQKHIFSQPSLKLEKQIIKLNSDIFSNLIYKHFNYCIDKGQFTNDLKHADIVPIYKKNKKCEKENYKPVSILSNLSKIYEKLMYNQLYEYFDNILFASQCRY